MIDISSPVFRASFQNPENDLNFDLIFCLFFGKQKKRKRENIKDENQRINNIIS